MRKFFTRRRRIAVRGKERRRKLRTAGLVLGMATAWSGEAKADITFRLDLAPERTMTNAYVLYNNNVTPWNLFRPLGTVPSGQTSVFFHTVTDEEAGLNAWLTQPASYVSTPNQRVTYAVIGLSDKDGAASVMLSFPNADVVTQGKTWEQLFYFYPSDAKSNILSDLTNYSPPYAAISFLGDYSEDFEVLGAEYGSPSTLVNFSTASFGGTAFAAIVPEPAAWILIVSAAGVVSGTRRRRNA